MKIGLRRHLFVMSCCVLLAVHSSHAADLVISDAVTTSGNWATTGNISAALFSGNGSGLSGVSAASLACTNCVSKAQLSFVPGSITSITAGSGLTGGGVSGDVSLSIAPGGVGVTEINIAQVQSRVTGLCSAGEYMQSIKQDGTVACAAANGSGGTVTQVNSGDGLTGGPITGSGTLSVDFVGTGSATTVARSDHNHDALYQKKYAKVIVVAESGGDFTSLRSAYNSITDNSATNRYLVKIMPGIYSVNQFVINKSYVDIEGSGENVTVISGDGVMFGVLVLDAGDNKEIRSLTVKNDYVYFTGDMCAVFTMSNGSTKLSNVTVEVTDSSPGGLSGVYGIEDYSSASLELDNVTINLSPNLTKAIHSQYGHEIIRNSTINGDVYATGTGSTFRIANSLLKGTISTNGTAKIVSSFDGDFNFIANGWY